MAYNLPDLGGELKLSRKAYTGIFFGEIKNWNDPLIAKTNPNMKLPKLTIVAVVRQDKSGTTFTLTKHLDAISERWRGRYGPTTLVNWPGLVMRASGNEGVAGLIQHSIGSIGYVGYEFARRLGLPMAVLENKTGNFVKPTEQSCTAALAEAEVPDNLRFFMPDPVGSDSYPIVTLTWILSIEVMKTPKKQRRFGTCSGGALVDGQNEAPKLNYVPLPPNVTTKALAALSTITPAE